MGHTKKIFEKNKDADCHDNSKGPSKKKGIANAQSNSRTNQRNKFLPNHMLYIQLIFNLCYYLLFILRTVKPVYNGHRFF